MTEIKPCPRCGRMPSERDEARISFLEHYIEFLGQRVGELEHRVYGLEMEVERMNRDQPP